MPTVGVVIIGNEILSGKFADENGPFLVGRLRALGADLRRIAVVPDTVEAIATEVRFAAAAFDRVITTGGVGPTHDDVTFEGVAAAYGRALHEEPELVAILRKYGFPLTDASRRMARVPVGARLIAAGGPVPVVVVDGTYVLPGVPKWMRAMFEGISAEFGGERPHVARVRTDRDEVAIADALTAVVAMFPQVDIGSYPREGFLLIALESRDAAALALAAEAVRVAVDGAFTDA